MLKCVVLNKFFQRSKVDVKKNRFAFLKVGSSQKGKEKRLLRSGGNRITKRKSKPWGAWKRPAGKKKV